MKAPFLTDTIINTASGAILCKDTSHLRTILSPIWEDVSIDPDFEGLDNKADLLAIAGTFLLEHGKTNNGRKCQQRARDLLTQAIDLYGVETEGAAIPLVNLARCYWYLGEVSNYEAILESITNRFDRAHPASILIKINQIIALDYRGDDEALDILETLYPIIKECPSLEVQSQFHNTAGIALGRRGEASKSVWHLEKAVELSRIIGNSQYLAFNLNNVAMAYLEASDFDSAHKAIAESILTAVSPGWEPHVLDTQASIYLKERRYPEALETIDRAINALRFTDDVIGMSTALFTKCKCLIRLEHFADVLVVFSELTRIQDDEAMARRYADMLATELRPTRSVALAPIHRTAPDGRRVCADFVYSGCPSFFFIANSEMLGMGAPIIALVATGELKGNEWVLYEQDGYQVGRVTHDPELNLLYVPTETEPIWHDSGSMVGQIAGYCPASEAQKDIVTFHKL
jgi:tetratricopeptide (TPR) repeat protein